MENRMGLPKLLFKYRDLTARTLDMLVGDKQYFADPRTFNDPLDTRPSFEDDVDTPELSRILSILIEKRTAADMRVGAKAMMLTKSNTKDWIENRSRKQARMHIAELEYGANNPDYEFNSALRSQLRYSIELELLQGDEGILSLAEKEDCPLMWSHYGDQHHGICLGYSVPKESGVNIQKVKYGGARKVKASDVAAMLDGDDKAHIKVRKAMLLRKAKSWSYEKEWRLLGQRGMQNSLLKLEQVVFGMKCKASVKYTVMKALEKRNAAVKFYEMREERGTFNLRKDELSYDDELFVHFPRDHLSLLKVIERLDVPKNSNEEK